MEEPIGAAGRHATGMCTEPCARKSAGLVRLEEGTRKVSSARAGETSLPPLPAGEPGRLESEVAKLEAAAPTTPSAGGRVRRYVSTAVCALNAPVGPPNKPEA